jgi:hypothetical protein
MILGLTSPVAPPVTGRRLAGAPDAGTSPAAMAARTAARPRPVRISSRAARSQHSSALIDTDSPVRRTRPRTTSSQEPNTRAAHRGWTDSKNARSTGPVASSRVVKMIRRPDRMAGVWVAIFTPATRIRAPAGQWCSSAERVTPSWWSSSV